MRKILLSALVCGVLGGGSLLAASLPDLFMYYQRAEQGATPGSTTRIDMVIQNRGQAPVERVTIDVICYHSYQTVGASEHAGSTSLTFSVLAPREQQPVSVDIQTNNKHTTVACYVDATHRVQESNESNNKTPGWINLFPKYIAPVPVAKPSPPISQHHVCKEAPVQSCSVKTQSARRDKYMSQLGLAMPSSLSHIQQYRIQWFSGSWSKWYTPGVDDIDWKDNCGDTYRRGGKTYDAKRPASCSRRVWSYFDDHSYQIKSCTTTSTRSCSSAPSYDSITPIVPPQRNYPCGDTPCDFVPLPRIPTPVIQPRYDCGDKPCDFIALPRIPEPKISCPGGTCGRTYVPVPKVERTPNIGGSSGCAHGTCKITDTATLSRPLSSRDKVHTSFTWGSWIR